MLSFNQGCILVFEQDLFFKGAMKSKVDEHMELKELTKSLVWVRSGNTLPRELNSVQNLEELCSSKTRVYLERDRTVLAVCNSQLKTMHW